MTKEKKGFAERIINIILNILIGIFSLLLLITIYNNVQTKIFKNTYSSFFGYSVFEVQTGSMADTINAGDWIIVKYQRAINLKDIITYEQDDNFITHRVVEVYKETLVTKGDFNNTKDEPISRKQVVGKVVKILPNFGIFRKTLFNPFVLLTLIITLYLAGSVCKNKRGTKKSESEDEKLVRGKEVVMKNLISKIKDVVSKLAKEQPNKAEEQLKVETNKSTEFENVEVNRESEVAKTQNEENNQPVVNQEQPENVNIIQTEKEEIDDTDPVETEVIEEKVEEEDLEKTMYFRMVSVDQDEIDSAYFNIPEISRKVSHVSKLVTDEKTPKKVKKDSSVKDTDSNEKSKEEDIKKELELLQKRKKKFKNILEKVMYIKTTEISELVEILNQREKSKTNEASIKKAFLNAYIDCKYYNYCGDVNAEYNGKNMSSKISGVIADVSQKLIKSYKKTDIKYEEKVRKYEKLFTLVLHLEQAFLVNEDIQEKRENYKNKISRCLGNNVYTDAMLKNVIQDTIKLQRTYSGMIKYSFEKLDTNMFELDLDNAISKAKKIYAAELKHNIAFSKVYSDYIVDKTYQEGIVAEDKIYVLLTLLLRQISIDMLEADFNKKYLLQVPESLYAKEKKFYNMIKVFEDEYAKNSIVMLIKYDDLSKYSKLIKECIKNGYHFAVDLENVQKIKVKDRGVIEIMDYIFMGRRSRDKKAILSSLSEEVNTKLIYVDITSRVGNSWGNER